MEIAIAEEKLQMYFSSGKIVRSGRISATASTAWDTVQEEHTAIWYVVNEDDTIKLVYVYAHVEVQKGAAVLMKVLEEELKAAEKDGRLKDGRAFGIIQGGMSIEFFEYHGCLMPIRFVG